ncbi:MAG TPA: prepilin-type N-terminal cleavage/methylation domain-containing protein, partial [Candidatus Rifleibacterium sp.]|nr:prepilin-type N-terminal cleavage/methylation domain-containing protein [Candidatus Rifleibacterium sp.]
MKKIFAFLKNRGFTLVEALVATIIAGYCILPIMGTLHMGIQKTQSFDHYEKLRLLARSRLNKELAVSAFDHTAIDTTTTYHYIYYNSDAEPKLLTIDTNLASGATEAGISTSPPIP